MFRSVSTFDRNLEKATSEKLLEPDWEATLQLCDSIRSGETAPKYAVSGIKKKLYHQNPHVCIFALQVLESCVKNCGSSFHVEITTRSFMEDLRELAKLTSNEMLRNKILELIQVWAHAFRSDPSCKAVQDTLNAMKAEGFKFPHLRESDAMFTAEVAPQWADGENCHRCRVQFGLVQRKHHCRCCGQVFCDRCSSKTSAISKFGIEKEVRVCDECYEKLNRTVPLSISKPETMEVSKNSSKASAPAGKSEQELREEEELQMAIALSKSEAEAKEKERSRRSASFTATSSSSSQSKSNLKTTTNGILKNESKEDPELSRYLDREYWEQKCSSSHRRSSSPAPSAPSQPIKESVVKASIEQEMDSLKLSEESDKTTEIDNFVSSLQKALDMFINRMNSNKLRGRPIANDSSVQSLFLSITNMHSQLIRHMQDDEDKRVKLESLQDKLNEIRDARAALDSLREEHREQKRREAEELEIMRQRQMAQRLEIMRKEKEQLLHRQREIALQRIRQQEKELEMRKEQHRYSSMHQQQAWQQQPPPPHQVYAPYGVPSETVTMTQGAVPPAPTHQPIYSQPPHYMPPASGYSYLPPGPQPVSTVPAPPPNQCQPPPPPSQHLQQPPLTLPAPQPQVPEEPLITFD